MPQCVLTVLNLYLERIQRVCVTSATLVCHHCDATVAVRCDKTEVETPPARDSKEARSRDSYAGPTLAGTRLQHSTKHSAAA